MKEYIIAHNHNAEILTEALNWEAKKGWVPTHFSVAAGPEADTYAVLLERESRGPGAIKGKLKEGRPA